MSTLRIYIIGQTKCPKMTKPLAQKTKKRNES